MALIAGVDIEQTGSGPDLMILHSLLAERSAFDRGGARDGDEAPVVARQSTGLQARGSVEDYADRVAGLLRALAARHPALPRRLIAAPALAAFPEAAKQPLRNLAQRVAKEGMAGATSRSAACSRSGSSRRIRRSSRSAGRR